MSLRTIFKMARRKRQFMDDDDDSDSYDGSEDGGDDFGLSNDPNAREERELFENPYKRGKRRKTGGKDDATYGVFAEDSEDEGFGGRSKKPERRADWTKCVKASSGFTCEYSFALLRAPSFVSGEKSTLKETTGEAEDGDGAEVLLDDDPDDEDAVAEEDSSDSDSLQPSKRPSPSATLDDDDESATRPRFGGIGSKRMDVDSDNPFTRSSSGIGFQKGGIGIGGGIGFQKGSGGSDGAFTKGGIGSALSGLGFSKGGFTAKTDLSDDSTREDAGTESKGDTFDPSPASNPSGAPDLPSSFATSRQQQRSFVREKDVPKRSATPLSAQERMHFNKLQGSFGSRMLSKMGWEAGTGLGSERTGIVTPIESKLRPKNMGIAYKGFVEKTEQSKAEARRRGEKVSDDEDEKPARGKGKGKDVKRAREDAWKKPKKSKLKVEHKTYEEILADAGSDPAPSGVGIIIDATGATVSGQRLYWKSPLISVV